LKYKGHHKIVSEIALQMGRAYQIVIANPANAKSTYQYIDAAQDCNFYFMDYANMLDDPILIDHVILNNDFKNIQLNTELRVKAYLEHDRLLGGGMYPLTPIDELKAKCDFNVNELLEK